LEFRISDTFTDSLGRLTGDEQKAVKTTAFDLQINPDNPGMSFHKLDKAKDKNFWSVRVGSDIRLIVHKTAGSMLLCYVDHHDKAYSWAERRKLETHPTTGAAQLVEVRERVQEITRPVYIDAVVPGKRKAMLFATFSEEQLLSYGVPQEWLQDVLGADEDSILDLADHLPKEAAEALLELATGGTPRIAPLAPAGINPFDHPDAQRRFRIMSDKDELELALAYPWEKWTVFLHPAQRSAVEADYSGPARVSGSAGTGKTIVALHRAVHLARSNPDARVLLATFTDALAEALHTKLRRLIGNQPRLAERLEVHSLSALGRRLYTLSYGVAKIPSADEIRLRLGASLSAADDVKLSLAFLQAEWDEVIDAWQIGDWEAYRDVRRLGRKTRLPEAQRAGLWSVFERVLTGLKGDGWVTEAGMFTRLTEDVGARRNPPFDFVVIDEAQDISVPQLRFLAALGASRPNVLFFAGDLGQRIFQQPFSWQSLGVDIRGRARTLQINYRTSHQIRNQADRLLGNEIMDVDGNQETRKGTVSVFNGPAPEVAVFKDAAGEGSAVAQWLGKRISEGYQPDEIGVIVRSSEELPRARAAAVESGLAFQILDDSKDRKDNAIYLCTMHMAKGFEFRAVVVMACDDEIVPSQTRIESVTDSSDLEEVYATERHLLYVACTRARDQLLVTGVEPASEFLTDLGLSP
jgi:superfamily I DNA/RNA helicase/mRNA-degrading endonuclease RelE of RelBE toxin-antitoxin system